MAAPTNHWKLGLFVVVGVVMALSTVAVLGARSLRTEVGRYVSYFDESVQGLDVGSPIKFRGVTIGTVGKIDVAPDHRHVEVTSELGVAELSRLGLDVVVNPRLGAPKKLEMASDLRVQLASAGLTGVKFLQLDFFTIEDHPPPELPFPVPVNYIPATSSTMKDLENSAVRAANRLPEIAERVAVILEKVDTIVGELGDKKLPERLLATLETTNLLLGEARGKLQKVDTAKLSREAEKAIVALNETVLRMNGLLARVDGERGLLTSVERASVAFGDTVRNADGLGAELERTLRGVQEAAKSIRKLADAIEKEPDMLVKGRSPEKKR